MARTRQPWYTPDVIHTIEQLRPDLVVSQAVRDARGQILLPAGATLTASSISQLAARGVQSVEIDVQESPEEREARIELERARIEKVLPESLEDPRLLQLRRVMLEVLDG